MMSAKPKAQKSKKNPSIDLQPTLSTVLELHVSQSECDYLINHGLGHKDHLTYYRRAIMDPKGSIQNPQYRYYVGDVADTLFKLIFGDNQLYTRLRSLLVQNYHGFVESKEEDETEDEKDDEEEDISEAVSMQRLRAILLKE